LLNPWSRIRKIQNDQDLLNLRNGEGLLNAMKTDDKDKVRHLLNEPYIDVNVKDKYGSTPLILTVQKNNPTIVEMLLDKGANPNIQDYDGYTALYWAIEKNNLEIVPMLFDKGANPNIQNNEGYTALDWAKSKRNQVIINLIIKAKEKLYNVGTSVS